MAAANASARGQRVAILASPLHELTGFCLAVDCLNPECRRDRMFAVTELVEFYGRQRTVAEVLRRMRSSTVAVGASLPPGWLPGPYSTLGSGRRVALLGPEAQR